MGGLGRDEAMAAFGDAYRGVIRPGSAAWPAGSRCSADPRQRHSAIRRRPSGNGLRHWQADEANTSCRRRGYPPELMHQGRDRRPV